MQLIHHLSFSREDIESQRQLIFSNLTLGLAWVIRAAKDMGLEVAPQNRHLLSLLCAADDINDYEPYPIEYYEVLKRLWEDPNVQVAYACANEAALQDKCALSRPQSQSW